MNPPSKPTELSLARLLGTAIRLASPRPSQAKDAFREQIAARDPDLKFPAPSGWDMAAALLVVPAILAVVSTLLVGAATWGGVHIVPWVGASLDNYRCSQTQACEPIAIRVVPAGALLETQWIRAFGLEAGHPAPKRIAGATRQFLDALKRGDRHFSLDELDAVAVAEDLADGDRRSTAAAREKSDAAASVHFIRQLAKGPASAPAGVETAQSETWLAPTASALARSAILASPTISISPTESRRLVTPAILWSSPAPLPPGEQAALAQIKERSNTGEAGILLAIFFFVAFALLRSVLFICRGALARLRFHRPELEKAAEVFELESAARRSVAQRGPRRSSRL